MLAQDFPTITSKDIINYMKKHDNRLLATYLDLDRAMNDDTRRPVPKHRRTQVVDKYTPERLPHTISEAAGSDPAYKRVLEEFQTARQLRNTKELKEDHVKMQEKEAEEQRAAGLIESCGCCCEESPFIQLVQCTGDGGHVSDVSLNTTPRNTSHIPFGAICAMYPSPPRNTTCSCCRLSHVSVSRS